MRSLRRWLLIALLSVLLVSGSVSGWLAYRSGLIEVGELFDAKLAHSARVLRGLVGHALDRQARHADAAPLSIPVWSGEAEGSGQALATASGHAYETKLAFQVWSADGRLLLRSDNAPSEALAPLQAGFHDLSIAEQRWRSFALQDEGGQWFLAGERDDVRGDIAGDIAADLIIPHLFALPLAGLVIWLVILFGERALRRVIQAIESRAVDDLQPISAERVPLEIHGLVLAINRLLQALDEAMQRERRFTADAAHELRTPISALRLQLSNLSASTSADQRVHAEQQLARGLARLDRLVAQLLTLSRLEPGVPLPATQATDLLALAREALVELGHAGLGRGIDIALDSDERPYWVEGEALSLGILLRNLIDNALRYTPGKGRIRLRLLEVADSIELWVEDSGPGIAEEARQRVLARFHRELGTSVEGSGLGLSIVERIARIHRADVELDRSTELGGLAVRIRFPQARRVGGVTAR